MELRSTNTGCITRFSAQGKRVSRLTGPKQESKPLVCLLLASVPGQGLKLMLLPGPTLRDSEKMKRTGWKTQILESAMRGVVV